MSRAIRSKFRIVGAFVLMFTMIFAMAVSVKAAGPGRPTNSTITISYPDQETGADFSKEKYAYTTGNKVTIKNTSPIRLKQRKYSTDNGFPVLLFRGHIDPYLCNQSRCD